MPSNTKSKADTRAYHDEVFKAVFADGGRATSFARERVAILRRRIEGVLEPVSTAFIDDESLRESRCDCLFKARMKPAVGGASTPGYVLILLEHKSHPAQDVLLQILKYLAAVAGRARTQRRPPPPVVPLLFYHGRKPWRLPEQLDMTFGKGARKLGLNLRVATVNLSELPPDRLARDPHTQAAFYAMRHISGTLAKSTLTDVIRAIPPLSPLARPIVVYLLGAGRYSVDAVRAAVNKFHPEEKEQIMHKSVMRYVDQGRVEGRVEGEAKIITRQLRRKFGPLPSDIQEQVAQATPDELESWSDRILDAGSLQAVFGGRAGR